MNIRRIGDGRKQTWPDDEVGSKASNLARMVALGLPVPPAFVLPIEDCAGAAEASGAAEQQLGGTLNEGIAYLETATSRKFGDRPGRSWFRSAPEPPYRCQACSTPCSMSAAHQLPPAGSSG